MGILSFYPGIENLGSSLGFLLSWLKITILFLSLELDGKPCLTTYGVKSRGYCGNGKFCRLMRTFYPFFLIPSSRIYLYEHCSSFFVLQLLIFLSWRVSTATEFRLPLLLLERSRTLTTRSTFVICLTITLDLSPLSTCWRGFIKKKKVSSSLEDFSCFSPSFL